MVNTVFKGDIAEVSWGMETGLVAVGDNAVTGFSWTNAANSSTITIGNSQVWASGGELLVPDNSLVGCLLRFTKAGTSNVTDDDYATTRRVFYITACDTTAATLTVQPALSSSAGNGHTGDLLVIDSIKSATFDPTMTDAAQKVQTDQFVGLLNSFSLPEPEIDVRRQHVVGLGRDVNVLTSGRETLAGGSMEMNAHNLRWMKYALGGHTAKSEGEFANLATATSILTENPLNIKDASGVYRVQAYGAGTQTEASQLSSLTLTGTSGVTGNALVGAKTSSDTGTDVTVTQALTTIHVDVAAAGVFKTLNASGNPLYASYTSKNGGNTVLSGVVDIDTGALAAAQTANSVLYLLAGIEEAVSVGDVRLDVGATIRPLFAAGDYVQIIDKDTHSILGQDATAPTVFKHEIRRVIAVDGDYLYVEQPFTFAHAVASCGIERVQYLSDEKRGSPHIGTGGQLHFGVEHTIFGHTLLPTFCIEQSFRQTDESPGAEQLLRLYSGCKVGSATMEADTEGEVKVKLDYEASRHYTDTSSVFTPHRMFENTANTAANRKVSGIAVDDEKPFLFQDLSIEAFGRPVLRGTAFSMQVQNSNTARWYIRGYEGQSADTDHVQNGGTQFATDITEARREYAVRLSAIIEDDRLWEEVRTRRHHKNTNDIVLRLKKRGSNATRHEAVITIEDYTIVRADHQIPDDKGAVTVDVELIARHVKITETSPYLTL